MIDGLKKGHIGSVALDVLEHEKNLERHNELLHMPNVTITPHIAFYADDTMHKMYSEAITTIKRFQNNEKLPHQVIGV
jgi:phosphoglycerate dehydrogenase-like enzyme